MQSWLSLCEVEESVDDCELSIMMMMMLTTRAEQTRSRYKSQACYVLNIQVGPSRRRDINHHVDCQHSSLS